MFRNHSHDCPHCIVVHNNWIVSKAAKIYRFKENEMWYNDGDSYYSHPERNYLTYENPRIGRKGEQLRFERQALRNAFAIGEILNRTVILPRFRCRSTRVGPGCPLNDHYSIQDLDQVYGNSYRENVFLNHPKVPAEVKNSRTSLNIIMSKDIDELKMTIADDVSKHYTDLKVTDLEITSWFSRYRDVRVLRFHSLYYAFSHFRDDVTNRRYRCKMMNGIQPDSYQQLKYYNKMQDTRYKMQDPKYKIPDT